MKEIRTFEVINRLYNKDPDISDSFVGAPYYTISCLYVGLVGAVSPLPPICLMAEAHKSEKEPILAMDNLFKYESVDLGDGYVGYKYSDDDSEFYGIVTEMNGYVVIASPTEYTKKMTYEEDDTVEYRKVYQPTVAIRKDVWDSYTPV